MKPLATAVSLLLAFACAAPVEETALRTQQADPSAYVLPQQANPGDYPDLRPTTTERPKPRVSRSAPRTTVARPARPKPQVTGDVFWKLALCESGGNPRAVSSTGKYRGAFQFSLATWRSVGMAGDPIQFDYETQLIAAKRLQARSGWGQWPQCARKLGLL